MSSDKPLIGQAHHKGGEGEYTYNPNPSACCQRRWRILPASSMVFLRAKMVSLELIEYWQLNPNLLDLSNESCWLFGRNQHIFSVWPILCIGQSGVLRARNKGNFCSSDVRKFPASRPPPYRALPVATLNALAVGQNILNTDRIDNTLLASRKSTVAE